MGMGMGMGLGMGMGMPFLVEIRMSQTWKIHHLPNYQLSGILVIVQIKPKVDVCYNQPKLVESNIFHE